MNILDFLKKAKRGPAVILPKDIAAIIANTGVASGWKVVDAGTGSGFLAMFLANLGCKVYTYEKEERFYKIAKKNIDKLSLKNIKIFKQDIIEGIKQKNVDLVTLDMKNPEKVIPLATKSLKKGGFIVIYSMHVEQMKKVIKELEKNNFKDIKTIETFQVEWQSIKNYTRPKTWLLGHTGFLTFARKI